MCRSRCTQNPLPRHNTRFKLKMEARRGWEPLLWSPAVRLRAAAHERDGPSRLTRGSEFCGGPLGLLWYVSSVGPAWRPSRRRAYRHPASPLPCCSCPSCQGPGPTGSRWSPDEKSQGIIIMKHVVMKQVEMDGLRPRDRGLGAINPPLSSLFGGKKGPKNPSLRLDLARERTG